MKKNKIQCILLPMMVLALLFTLLGCAKAEDTERATATTESTEVSETVAATEPSPEPLSPEMGRYHEAVKENTVLLAQQEYLNNAILYYQNIKVTVASENFEMTSFEEEIFGTEAEAEDKGEYLDYPEFDAEAVEVTIPEIEETQATEKSEELEAANEELKQAIADLQVEADNLKLICGM